MTDRVQRSLSRMWFALAIGSLVLAGILAALLVIARVPPFHDWITDPLFFKRCLVVHVDLSLFVWFSAFLMFLYSRLPRDPHFLAQEIAAIACAITGVMMMVIAAGMPASTPILSNYLPVIDHPLFLGGLVAFATGIGLQVLQPRLFTDQSSTETRLPEVAQLGLRAAGIAILFAVITIWAAWWQTSRALGPSTYFELLFWGGGHVFQFANTCGMLVAWTALTAFATGKTPCSRRTAFALFAWLLLPVFAAPLLTLAGTGTTLYRTAFTAMMQWGIFPVVLVFLALCFRRFWQTRHQRDSTYRIIRLGFASSVTLTLLGFGLGAMIRGSNTLVPAHYHANIGAVTCAYMTLTFAILAELGYHIKSIRLLNWSRWQPAAFGLGQAVFAAGFGLAGAYGMGRKLYGSEQAIHSTAASVGLVVMGIGGLMAIVGGIAYLTVSLHAMAHADQDDTAPVGEKQIATI